MHNISFNGFDLNAFIMCTELHLQSDLFFNLQFIFLYIYKEQYSLLLRLLRRTMLRNLLPRTTFVREEASRDEALRTTERRAWNILLPFNSTFILYRVFSTLCARKHLRRYSKMLKQTKKTFLSKSNVQMKDCFYLSP